VIDVDSVVAGFALAQVVGFITLGAVVGLRAIRKLLEL
jgi:hypothetical protein